MKCQICGRKLKSVRSIVRGMGCTCARRDKEQLKLEFEKVDKNEQTRTRRGTASDIRA